MSLYAGGNRERIIQIDTALEGGMQRPQRSTKPHFQVSPRTAQGLPTQGILLTLIEPAMGAAQGSTPEGYTWDPGGTPGSGGAAGFTVTLFRCVPAISTWAELAPFTALARYGDQYVLPDISGGWGLFIRITGDTTPGRLLVGIAEMD